MAEKSGNNKQQLIAKQNQQLARNDVEDLEVTYTKKNEANINIAGIKLNIDLLELGANIKKFREKRAAQKALKERQKELENADYIVMEEVYVDESSNEEN